MTMDAVILTTSRVILTGLTVSPGAGIWYNAVDLAVTTLALKYLIHRHPEADWGSLVCAACILGCVTGHLLTPGMNIEAAMLISGLSTALLLATIRALPERNDAVRC